MVSDIYMFDLETLRWEKIEQSPEDDIPQARYFHSADACECVLPSAPNIILCTADTTCIV